MNPGRIKLLEEYISEDPNDPFNWYALAMEYYEEEPEKSRELLDQLITNLPDYLPAYYKAAHLYWYWDNLEKAKQLFEAGIKLAENTKDDKALGELKASYKDLVFEMD